ncbi:hypothetical protein GLR44_09360 [Escherichia coli]|nr:hypothetical protein [Escherichia coli]HAW2985517.1 hypothetical protein [Escherichia coli]
MSRYKTGHKQPRFRYSVLARCVAWANISVQVLFPLAVTFTPVMAARAQHAVQPRLSMGNTTVTADNNVEKNVASFAANAGTFLSSQPDSDATRNFITGMATAKANQEIQEWLGKYGTARVKLNVDKDFSLKDSSLEMLYPIYDTPTNMLFTQGAIHRTDDRTQSNIGFGWRHFSGNDWMAGVNTFIDHDLSRSHTRIGVGAEYWRDYLKLSANGYIRASGWKKSPDIEDYQERPANGWDIRAEGYLPAWPQLGASLMYEQYYGDEVGLFGKDKRQKDPHAISAEVTYTPVPLLTLSAGHKQGKSGENDTRFGLEVNYRIGEPLEKQLDTDSIRERRVLAGSRYDLVERNNNIVLEYRKSEVIRIALPERIEGKGGQTLSLGLVVSKATHGLKNVQWEAPSLLAEGGKITGQGSQWQVTLPAYRPGKDNYYAISAVAYDNKGNTSKRVQTEVVITRDELFITSKLWVQDMLNQDTAAAGIEASLKKSGLEYFDLYLLHQAMRDYFSAWRALEDAYEEGKLKAIGVSNFYPHVLANFCETVRVKPMVNQVELHPYFAQPEALATMKYYNVQPEAWAPLGGGRHKPFENNLLQSIADAHQKSISQVILRWNIQRGVVVIPKSTHQQRIEENFAIWDFSLTEKEMAQISSLDLGYVGESVKHFNPEFVRGCLAVKIHD